MRRFIALGLLAIACLVTSARSACGADFYYMLVFGYENDPKQFRYSHTYATFVKATGEGLDPSNYALTVHTISWLPRNLDVRVLRLRPEPGQNLDLDSTMRFAAQEHASVTMWGPYRITPEIYAKSIEQYHKLMRGEELYRAIDGPINNRVSDCIHAVGEVDPVLGRRRYALDKVGKPASAYIAKQFVKRTHYDQSQIDNGWLIPRLGLTQYPIEYVGNQGSARLAHYEFESFMSRLRMIHSNR